ncbi:MAG: hypothetical protein ACYTEQ_09500 [Planctomycetota bacterium]|jgi:hypothetical protein
MKVEPRQRYNGLWILASKDGSQVGCSKEWYDSEEEARADLPRVLAALEVAREKALIDILAELEAIDTEEEKQAEVAAPKLLAVSNLLKKFLGRFQSD